MRDVNKNHQQREMGALKAWKVLSYIVSDKGGFIFVIIIHSANSCGYLPCSRYMTVCWGNKDD